MSITLTAVDNGSRSVSITVAGSGGPITIQGARWNGRSGPSFWFDLGNLGADGVLTVVLPAFGGWMLIAGDTAGGYTNPLYLPVVDTRLAIQTQCEDSVVETIKRLNLTGIGDRVFAQLVAHDVGALYPCVFCTCEEGTESIDAGGPAPLNSTESIGYPVKIQIATRDDIKDKTVRGKLAKWRQPIRRAFSKQRLADVPSAQWTVFEPGRRMQLSTFPQAGQNSYSLIASVAVIRCYTREPRGFMS